MQVLYLQKKEKDAEDLIAESIDILEVCHICFKMNADGFRHYLKIVFPYFCWIIM